MISAQRPTLSGSVGSTGGTLHQQHSGVSSNRIQGPVVRSLVSANRWLKGIKTYRFPWYLTLVSANHASSNPGQACIFQAFFVTK